MKYFIRLIIYLFIITIQLKGFSQQLTFCDIANRWKKYGIDYMEGIYAIYNKQEDILDKNTFYGVIRFYNRHKIFVCYKEDTVCTIIGTFKKLGKNSFLSDIQFQGNYYYNTAISFSDDFNNIRINMINNYELIKVYPDFEESNNKDKNNNTKIKDEIKIDLLGSDVFEVPVILNGVLKIYFFIDTGASETQISPDVFLTLYRSKTIDEDDRLPGKRFTFADGSSSYSDRYLLKSLKIGDIVIYDVAVTISESIKAPMLLGQNVLSRLGEFHIDYENKKLIIKK